MGFPLLPPGGGGVSYLTSCVSGAIVLCLGFPSWLWGGCPTLPLVSLVPLSCVCRDPLFVQCRDPGVVALEYRKYDDDDRRVQSSTSLPQHQVLRIKGSC